MLGSKLRRAKIATGTFPSFILNDPDFAVSAGHSNSTGSPPNPETAPGPGADQDADDSTGGSVQQSSVFSGGGTFTLGKHHTAYADLPEAAHKLDSILYNIFKMRIKGSKQALVRAVRDIPVICASRHSTRERQCHTWISHVCGTMCCIF